MSLLKQIDSSDIKVGMRVQDHNGNCGRVAWCGKLEKTPPPPHDGSKGTYAGVVFDEAKPNSPWRCAGTLGGYTLVPNAAPGTVAFLAPKRDLWVEVVPQGIVLMRKHFGDRIATWHDVEVTKFLVARKFDIAMAVAMLDEHLKWEADHGVKVTEYFPDRMAVCYPAATQPGKYDFEGNMIRVERPANGGVCHPKEFVAEFGLPLIMRWHICAMEQIKQQMRDQQWRTSRVCFIIDLIEFGSVDRQVAKFGQMEGKIDQDHYPEIMARCFIINAPFLFQALWAAIKLFVDDRTKAKIQILGADYRPTLLKYMDESCLPKCAGGTNDAWLESTAGGKVGALTKEAGAAIAAKATKAEEEEAAAVVAKIESEEAGRMAAAAAAEAEAEKAGMAAPAATDDNATSSGCSSPNVQPRGVGSDDKLDLSAGLSAETSPNGATK